MINDGAPGGEKHDDLLLFYFFWMIFDLYKQEPIWASTAGDRGSVPVTLCSYMYWYLLTGFLIKSVFFKWQVVPCNGIRIPESVKFLLVESGILGYGIWNTSKGIRDPTDKDWNQEPEIRNQRREIQNPRLPWLALTWGLTERHGQGSLIEAMLKTELPPTKNKTFTQSLHRQSNVIDCTF